MSVIPKCPNCGRTESKISNSRHGLMRTRTCKSCFWIFHTRIFNGSEHLDHTLETRPPKEKLVNTKPRMRQKEVTPVAPNAVDDILVLQSTIVEVEISEEVLQEFVIRELASMEHPLVISPRTVREQMINKARRIQDQKRIDKEIEDDDPWA